MGRIKTTLFAAFAGVALTAAALAAQGVPSDRSTFVTVSGPVSLPGVTLPAGTYLFRLADSLSTRNVVQIFDKDRTKIFATILAVRAERMEPSDEAVITFKETPSDRPPAVHYWYYAGEKSGQEFVYPKAEAMRIAAASGESVLSVDTAGEDMEAMKTAEITRVEPGAVTESQAAETSPAAQNTETAAAAQTAQQPAMPNEQQSPATQAESTTPQPAPATTQSETTHPETQPSAESTPPAASANSRDTSTAPMMSQQTPRATGTSGRSELPRTASHEPLVALMGFIAMSVALSLHAIRKTAAARSIER